MNNTPKAYQQGYTEFFKLKFKVTSDVLIPRPETELLVDEVIKYVGAGSSRPFQGSDNLPPTILDVGTGSGCIAISLAVNLPQTIIIASDISSQAIIIAQENAKNILEKKNQVIFLQGNLLENIKICPDIIVSNLPYIPSARIPHLDSSVKDFEPHQALDGGKDGFDLYRKLFQQIQYSSFSPQGWHLKLIVCEIDDTQGKIALKEAQKYFPEANIKVTKDLFKRPRILVINNSKNQI